MAVDSSIQRITRLTPLSAILALIEARVAAVTPQKSSLHAARDFTLAEDVVASECPPRPIALRDGFPWRPRASPMPALTRRCRCR